MITRWKGTSPFITDLIYRPPDRIDAELLLDCNASDWSPSDLEHLDGEARALVERLLGDSFWLTVEEDSIELDLAGAQMDAGTLLKRLRELAALAALLRTRSGPYL